MGVTWEALSPEQVREVVDVLKETCDALLRSQGEPTPQVRPWQPPGLTCAPSLIPSFAARFNTICGNPDRHLKWSRMVGSKFIVPSAAFSANYCGCLFVGEGHGQFNAVAVGRLAGPSVTANKLPTARNGRLTGRRERSMRDGTVHGATPTFGTVQKYKSGVYWVLTKGIMDASSQPT